ncbi:MAG: hypothetical protein KIT84_18885 [Labilithrix sp.]|nr:hypothetical protein [Labilithrix sp.]MCW5813101.1 hypothetical protein [Labilithrix sp.]
MRIRSLISLLLLCVAASGCATMDIPQAHRGRKFSRTGLFALYTGGDGISGPVLDPGTHFLGLYNELRIVDCSTTTVRESLDTLTHDGVHFGFDIVVRFSADCSDEGVQQLITNLRPDQEDTVSARRVYDTYVQPAIGEAAREFVSPLRANELNEKQAAVADGVKRRFNEIMATREKKLVKVYEVNISHLQFPQALDTANLERAAQAVMRDKSIAERERVTAEVETMTIRRKLAEQEAEVAVVKIEKVGAALAKNPAYVQYELVLRLPEIYREAGARGNMILAAPNPFNLPQLSGPSAAATPPPPPSTALPAR